MSSAIIIAIVIVFLLLFIGGFALVFSSSQPTPVTEYPVEAPAPVLVSTPGTAPTTTYRFYQGKDSGGNDIKNAGELVNNVSALKDACTALANCKGFNTNAWMKHTILPESQWYTWTADPTKGLYVKNVERLVNWW